MSSSKKQKKRRKKREDEEEDDEAELDDEEAERVRNSLMEKRSTHFLARDDITEEELNERYRSQRRAAAGNKRQLATHACMSRDMRANIPACPCRRLTAFPPYQMMTTTMACTRTI